MNASQKIKQDIQELVDRGVDSSTVYQYHRSQLANEIRRQTTPSEIGKLTVKQGHQLLDLFDSFTSES